MPGLKTGIMGCIVNGPGEMADADYGYTGTGRGGISLYKGKRKTNLHATQIVRITFTVYVLTDKTVHFTSYSMDM
jgi:4-hydroxy-3-methylbut-2-en-1-yl diphosphate synthase IspG/GcpE